jgi:hypothetical protein
MVFSTKSLPLSVLEIKLKLSDSVASLETIAKNSFEKIGPLLLKSKVISNKKTLLEEGIKDGSEITSVIGGGVKYKEKRD